MNWLIKNPLDYFKLPDFSKKPVFNFISKRSGPFDGSVTLTRDRVYIVPTKAGLMFALLLLTLLIGSINYEKNLGFILTFLLAGVGNIALLSTWRNIAGLELKRTQSQAVFAGEEAIFSVQLINPQLIDRYSIAISHNGKEYSVLDCAANSTSQIQFKVPGKTRGLLNPEKFRLYTEFPTGLFVAWTWVDLSMSCLVYPSPDQNTTISSFEHNNDGDNDSPNKGQENFSQLRKYQHGDNINHISWKVLAKTDELFSKEFYGSSPLTNWINWDEIPAKNNEQRLSIMTTLIINAENNNQHYGLKLPNKTIQPSGGTSHYHHCLSTLALY
ncbi:MAG: hypothetical protein COA54_04600 [Thiotrichaceae bacterium]|nr:MAG: hypothetical protein COA54_04600 [Thiotrichaceae bacterium]